MKTHEEVEKNLLGMPNTWLDFPYGKDTYVYKVGDRKADDGKMFALIAGGSKPLRLSLKCDPLLAEKLRADYETVLPGHNLDKKHWNTIICTGQVPDDELKSLIIISYDLAKNS